MISLSGDGANDVSMIQAADIGIGISGQEGMQVLFPLTILVSSLITIRELGHSLQNNHLQVRRRLCDKPPSPAPSCPVLQNTKKIKGCLAFHSW